MTESNNNKSLIQGTTLSIAVIVVTALFLMLNYLSLRHYQRWDWTGAKLYTLSEKSKQVVLDLDRDVDIIVLLDPASELYTAANELLDRYVAVNPQRIERRDMDAAKDLLALQQLVDQYDIQRDNVIVIAADGDKRVIAEHELVEYDYSGSQFGQPPTMKAFKGEQLITSAILSLVESRKQKLVFTTGHGEATFDPGDPRSLSQAREILGGDNFEIEEWSSLGAQGVPSDADLLVIAGPTTNFLPPELELFDAYLKRGGRLLLFADPAFQPGSTGVADLGLDDWLKGYGVKMQSDIVVDPAIELPFFGPETLYTDHYGVHPIVESLDQTRTRVMLPLVRSVAADEPTPPGIEVTELISTSDEGWGETNLDALTAVTFDDQDLPGPVPVAVAVTVQAQVDTSDDAYDDFDDFDDTEDSELPLPETEDDGEAPDSEPLAPMASSGTDEPESGEPLTTFGGLDDESDHDESDHDDEKAPDRSKDARMVIFGDLDFATDAQVSNGAHGLLLLNAFNWLVEREKLIDIEGKAPTQSRLSIADTELMGLYGIFVLLMPALAIAAGIWIALQRRR